MTDNPKLLSLLGMCRKARRLSCGHDAAIGSIRSREACLCLLSSDASDRLKAEMKRELSISASSARLIILNSTMEDIKHATGLRSAVLTVNDNGFAQSMCRLTDNTDGEVTV